MKLLKSCVSIWFLFGSAAAQASDWRIVTVDGAAAVGEASIGFRADGSYSGNTGCNLFQGQARYEGGQLVIEGPMAHTKKACADDALVAQEAAIVGMFAGTMDIRFDPLSHTMTVLQDDRSLVLARLDDEPGSEPDASDVPSDP
ncbi:META domain-containing protein [Pseudohalocynthiibacter aestuariivivens]|nr:META domain-containing protein [Pseudohalocynthiibacter aestuariivivens]QIE45926.1 META domain-containing protein [Pseudohalocynthiibacter aestuariivivens]